MRVPRYPWNWLDASIRFRHADPEFRNLIADGAYRYGMGGLRLASAGRMSVGRLEIEDFA